VGCSSWEIVYQRAAFEPRGAKAQHRRMNGMMKPTFIGIALARSVESCEKISLDTFLDLW
jgi:hypothetical protein